MCHGFIETQSFTSYSLFLVSCIWFCFPLHSQMRYVLVNACTVLSLFHTHLYTLIHTRIHSHSRINLECHELAVRVLVFIHREWIFLLLPFSICFFLLLLSIIVFFCSGKVGRLAKVVSLLNIYVIIVILKAYCKHSSGFNLWSKRRVKKKEERETWVVCHFQIYCLWWLEIEISSFFRWLPVDHGSIPFRVILT